MNSNTKNLKHCYVILINRVIQPQQHIIYCNFFSILKCLFRLPQHPKYESIQDIFFFTMKFHILNN